MNEYIDTLNFGKVPIRRIDMAGEWIEDIEISDSDEHAEIRKDAKTGEYFAVLFDKDWNFIESNIVKGENMEEKYNVYKIESNMYYAGISLVAARNLEEANKYIQEFKDNDKDNDQDSYGYSSVHDDDLMYELYSYVSGIIYCGIYYRGY